MVTASICTIGDEILIGQIVDTNSSKISVALNSIGVKVNEMVSTSDREEDIVNTIERCLKATDIVIVTGGLGPTKDDITKKTLGKLSGAKEFVKNEEQYKIVEKLLTARGVEMSDLNVAQAYVPDSCTVILNECGTAPCMLFEFDKEKYGHEALLFSLPGVPFEAEAALPKVLKIIQERYRMEKIFHKTICTFGIPESTLAKTIEDWEDNLPENLHLAYLPNPTLGVRLRLSIYGVDKEQGERELEEESKKLEAIIGDAIYGVGEDSLQAAIGRMLKAEGATISTAESCTGGSIASLLTSVPGASQYFYGGIVAYDNSVKINTLCVKKETIEKFGAVSKECVEEMALGVKRVMGTEYSIATSGVAGPDGGSEINPVGTVWIAVSGPDFLLTKKLRFHASRKLNIDRFSSNALNFMRLELQNRLIKEV
ncbi:MAG: CinA family nicotinamide mononucleotide deamidase-related protein [Bacteroidales bacterium]|nr:CinA family nicotinamide mononucleotide deamidase-related protein [Bacteroidales bacterium]